MNKKYEVIRVSGIATGVGFVQEIDNGKYSDSICETLFDTGNDEKDAEESEYWANKICAALSSPLSPAAGERMFTLQQLKDAYDAGEQAVIVHKRLLHRIGMKETYFKTKFNETL